MQIQYYTAMNLPLRSAVLASYFPDSILGRSPILGAVLTVVVVLNSKNLQFFLSLFQPLPVRRGRHPLYPRTPLPFLPARTLSSAALSRRSPGPSAPAPLHARSDPVVRAPD